MTEAHDHFQQHAGEDEADGQEQQKTDEFMQSGLFGRHGRGGSFTYFHRKYITEAEQLSKPM